MRRLLVITALLLTALVVPVTTATPAHAKGPTAVVVSGPGIEDRRLRYTRADDVDVGTLSEASGIWQIYGAAIATDDPDLSKAELGPRYVLTWYVGHTVMAVSHVYPFSTQSAWMNIPHEDGGWVRGGPDLERAMVELGAEQPKAESEVSTSSTAVGSGRRPGVGSGSTAVGSGSPTQVEPAETSTPTADVSGQAWLVGIAALAVLVGGGAWLQRRRSGTLSPWPQRLRT